MATLIGLLASCGLRISEALALRLGDADLDVAPPRLQVLQSKFGKSRLVPVHTSTAAALRAYIEQRRLLGYHRRCDFIFVSERRERLAYSTAAETFVFLARQLGIRGPVGERGASLHSLRHTFAVRRLIEWYREGYDIHARMPELSVYLGHVDPRKTYWYLSATPELLSLAAERFENHANARGGK